MFPSKEEYLCTNQIFKRKSYSFSSDTSLQEDEVVEIGFQKKRCRESITARKNNPILPNVYNVGLLLDRPNVLPFAKQYRDLKIWFSNFQNSENIPEEND